MYSERISGLKSSAIRDNLKRTSKKKILRNLQSLTNIGPAIAEKLYFIGIRSPEEVINTDPDELYQRLQGKLGCHVDRCVLYVFRGAKTGRPWPECSDNPKSGK